MVPVGVLQPHRFAVKHSGAAQLLEEQARKGCQPPHQRGLKSQKKVPGWRVTWFGLDRPATPNHSADQKQNQ